MKNEVVLIDADVDVDEIVTENIQPKAAECRQ
jgi:hypothetical protein